MARATRSSHRLADEKPKDTLENTPASKPSPTKALGKKRKRTSHTEPEEQPAPKQPRNDEQAKLDEPTPSPPQAEPLGAGDVSLDARDAERILEILERIDTQGLLDREFPLPSESLLKDPQPSNPPQSYSFRALLKDPSRYPARVLYAAVKPLFPVFSHPRSRPSAPAAQQLKFCSLTRALLDQATRGTNPIVGALESAIPIPTDNEQRRGAVLDIPRQRKYALMQKLPNGEWWTSLNSPSSDPAELKDLVTGHAELVAILPTPAGTVDEVPTLSTYARSKQSGRPQSKAVPGSRRLSAGAFLDYGPYASFAPTFEQDGTEVGRVALGEVLWWEDRKRRLERALGSSMNGQRGKLPALPVPIQDMELDPALETGPETRQDVDAAMEDSPMSSIPRDVQSENDPTEILKGLLPPDQIEGVKATLDDLSLEEAVQELLERTSKALRRLNELQNERLGGPDGGSSTVDQDSEEFAIAEGISDSLTLLASLRPRSSTSTSAPLIPPHFVLRQLHRSLPVAPSPGWRGTLPIAHPTALHDDTTIHVKSGTVINTAVPAVATPATPSATVTATPATNATAATVAAYATKPSTSYAGYVYPSYATANAQYRSTATTATAGTPAAAGTTYPYSSNTYYNYAAAGQQQPQQQQAQSHGYGAYAAWYGAGGQRAVANTVTPAKVYGAWQGAGTGYTPTLSVRTAASAASGYQQWGSQHQQQQQAGQ